MNWRHDVRNCKVCIDSDTMDMEADRAEREIEDALVEFRGMSLPELAYLRTAVEPATAGATFEMTPEQLYAWRDRWIKVHRVPCGDRNIDRLAA